jgi:hypothetical protein
MDYGSKEHICGALDIPWYFGLWEIDMFSLNNPSSNTANTRADHQE